MAPLIILLVTFAAVYLLDRFLLKGRFGLSFAGRAAMSVMLLATGITHFTDPEPMAQMMPEVLPFKLALVYFTGICELLAVVGLLWKRTVTITSVLLILFFIAVLPANIAGSLKSVQFGGMEYGPLYLLFRIPVQIFFIGWVYYFGLRRPADEARQGQD